MAGHPPDIATLYDPDIRAYIERDLLEPLDDVLKDAGVAPDGLVPTAQLGIKAGRVYGIPMQVNVRALYYNSTLLAEADIANPPKNLADFMAAVRALRKPDKQQFGFATISKPGNVGVSFVDVMPIVVGFGGGFFADGKPAATAPVNVAALKFLKQLYDEGLIPRGTDVNAYRQMFQDGKVAMYVSGPFMAAATEQRSPETYRALRTTLLPFPGDGRTIAVTVFWAIPKGAQNPDLAKRFLTTLLEDRWQKSIVKWIKASPARKNMITPEFTDQYPWYGGFLRSIPLATSYAPQGAEQYGAEVAKVVMDHIEGMLFTGIAPDDAATNMQKALQALVAAKGKS